LAPQAAVNKTRTSEPNKNRRENFLILPISLKLAFANIPFRESQNENYLPINFDRNTSRRRSIVLNVPVNSPVTVFAQGLVAFGVFVSFLGSLVGRGVDVASGADVAAWVGATVSVGAGGSVDVDRIGVGVSNGSIVGVERGGRIPVGVGVGSTLDVAEDVADGPGFDPLAAAVGGRRVLIAVRKTGVIGVTVTDVAPAVPASGHPCNATGNSKQLDASAQIFKLNVVNCVPLQTRTRFPFSTSAVRHVTGAGAVVSTSKMAKSGKMRTACGRSLTQN
jgi:hypothetical protein